MPNISNDPFYHSINVPPVRDTSSNDACSTDFEKNDEAFNDDVRDRDQSAVFLSHLKHSCTSRRFPMYHSLWFEDEEDERQFVVSSFFHTRWRFFILGIVFILGVVAALLMETGEVRPYYIASLIYLVPATITHTVVVVRSYFNISRKGILVLSWIHEFIGALSFLYIAIYFGLVARVRTDNCDFMIHHDPNARDNEHCPQLYLWVPFFAMVPLFLGQPRFFISFLVLVVAAILFFAITRFHNTSSSGAVILHAIYALHLIFVGVFKFILERQERRRFAAEGHLIRKLDSIRGYSDSLHAFVATLAPHRQH